MSANTAPPFDNITAPWAPYIERAVELHATLAVAAGYFEYYGYDSLFAESGAAQCDLAKLDRAHVRLFGIAVANGSANYFQVGPDDFELAGDRDWAHARLLRLYDDAMLQVRRCPRVRVIRWRDELDAPRSPDTIDVLPLITGHAWMRTTDDIRTLFDRGLRISHSASLSCAHWCRSYPIALIRGQIAPAFNEEGRAAVACMNELGIAIDLAHYSAESAREVILVSTKPVIDGHTGSRSINPSCRGHTDETLKMIADRGGVAGIHFADQLWTHKVWARKYDPDAGKKPHPLWDYNRELLARVSDPDERSRLRKSSAARQAFFAARGFVEPPVSQERIGSVMDMADHLDHMVNVMGIEHVGLGGDVNGITMHAWPAGCNHVGELPHLTAELMRRGWSNDALQKFLADNWRRVFRETLPAAPR